MKNELNQRQIKIKKHILKLKNSKQFTPIYIDICLTQKEIKFIASHLN